jgi:hypothetical protein
MKPFFQISAATGGMTKKGEMTMMRRMPWPQMGWSISSARKGATDDSDEQNPADQDQRIDQRDWVKDRIADDVEVVPPAGEAGHHRIDEAE